MSPAPDPRARAPRARRSELHAWRLPRGFLDLEERPRLEAEHPGDDVRRDRLTRVLVAEDGVVVDLARDADLVLRVLELRLQLTEVLARAELRIRLRDGEQAADRRGERVLGLGLLLDALRFLRMRPGARHLLEGAALVRRVALHGLDEVRDQVVAAPELYVDLRPRVAHAVPEPHESVVERDQEQRADHCDRDGDENPGHRATLLGRAAGDPDRVFATGVWPAVEPAVVRLDVEPGRLDQRSPLLRRQPPELQRRLAALAANGQRQRARPRVPLGAFEDARLALEPAAGRFGDIVVARCEHVEREAARREEEVARRAESTEPCVVVAEVQVRAKWTRDERHALAYGRVREVAEAEVDRSRDACGRGSLGTHLEHPRRRVDADHADARRRGRNGDPAGADPELDDGAPGAHGEVHVELH